MRLLVIIFFLYATYVLPFILQEENVSNLKENDSAFDEIQNINKAANIERNHPLGKHIFEGDILVRDNDQPVTGTKRESIRDDLRLWRTREIPYVISPDKMYAKSAIVEGLADISSRSCIKFVERTKEEDFITFVNKEGCWSTIGLQRGGQDVSLGKGCERNEIVAHLVLHALGFYHEQNRPDRDSYITVNWNNIRSDLRINFKKVSDQVLTTLGVQYDKNSIMHYGNYAFGDGRITLEDNQNPEKKLGNKDGLTDTDFEQLNTLYHCKSIPHTGYGPWEAWSPCIDEVERKYRICYGKQKCFGPEINGIQHLRMKCDSSSRALMKGCFNQDEYSTEKLMFQEYATMQSCSMLHSQQNLNTKVAYAFLECMRQAQRSKKTIFGLTEFCKCHYGDDEINIRNNGESDDCGDGYGNTQNSIYMYKIVS